MHFVDMKFPKMGSNPQTQMNSETMAQKIE